MIAFYSQNTTGATALIKTFEQYQLDIVHFLDFKEICSSPADIYIFDDLSPDQIEQTKGLSSPCFYLQVVENNNENTIIKPFKPLYLMARIYPFLICASKGEIKLKDAILNTKINTLTIGDSTISLTSKETQILIFLSQNENGVSKDELLSAVWGYGIEITTHTLETHIYQLRNKLEETHLKIVLSGDKYTIA